MLPGSAGQLVGAVTGQTRSDPFRGSSPGVGYSCMFCAASGGTLGAHWHQDCPQNPENVAQVAPRSHPPPPPPGGFERCKFGRECRFGSARCFRAHGSHDRPLCPFKFGPPAVCAKGDQCPCAHSQTERDGWLRHEVESMWVLALAAECASFSRHTPPASLSIRQRFRRCMSRCLAWTSRQKRRFQN